MLKKSKISHIKIHSDEWANSRLAKFTSSEIHNLMGGSFDRYVRQKVGEFMTGRSAKGEMEVDVNATRWGVMNEYEAIQKFGKKEGLEFVIAQQLITETGSRFGCTPDFLKIIRISPDETEYEVETGEVKCPFTFENYIALFECETPQDVKKEKKEYYWQDLDQMENCEAIRGHFVAYHPEFRSGNMRHIIFDKMQQIVGAKGQKVFPIYDDLKLLKEQKTKAVLEFHRLCDKLMTAGKI